jgi:hypothetical protein
MKEITLEILSGIRKINAMISYESKLMYYKQNWKPGK